MGLRRMGPCSLGVFVLALVSACTWVWADGSRYAMTHSRSQFVHWVFLYDANGTRIDPTDPAAPPYSPRRTCGRCHDYDAVAQGHHFNATDVNALAGRPGEPWVWTDNRTGTQLPLSYRNWPGTYRPGDAGVAPWDLLLKFGRHMPGGGPGEIAGPKSEEPSDPDGQDANAGGAEKSDAGTKIAATESRGRWPLSGQLEID
ncbi:MAG: hypothetical protein FJ276_27775, partial [Planctomycetes bacterium]|nr:hypothetical protein [Planctomycetota bacterium]